MTEYDLDLFMADPDLAHLLEQSKVSDDIFDVVALRENQHSDMLAWCLDPNEGHGQSDAVIKDFLLAAWEESSDSKYMNKRFFETWRPARIRTTTFGAAFLTRELGVELNIEARRGRLDLFLVDPINKLVVTIENKAGRKLSPTQLNEYWDAVRTQVAQRRAFQGYDFAFVVVDRERSEDSDLGTAASKWIVLDYAWLKTSAARARHHIARSNNAAQLLMAYCQRQTDDWQSEKEKRLIERAGNLAVRHVRVLDRLRSLKRDRITSWTPTLIRSTDGELLRFYHQHRLACKALLEGSGIAAVASTIKRLRPELPTHLIKTYRQRLALGSNNAEACMDEDADEPEWPISVVVRRHTSEDNDEARFQVRLLWITSAFAAHASPDELRQIFEEYFPALQTHRTRNVRRITVAGNLNAVAAAEKSLALSAQIDHLLQEYLGTLRDAICA